MISDTSFKYFKFNRFGGDTRRVKQSTSPRFRAKGVALLIFPQFLVRSTAAKKKESGTDGQSPDVRVGKKHYYIDYII
jgi:hypothetical protein